MTDLIMPTDGPRVSPRTPEQVNANVRAELDKARLNLLDNERARAYAAQRGLIAADAVTDQSKRRAHL